MTKKRKTNKEQSPQKALDELAQWKKLAEENLQGWQRAKADFVNYKRQEAEARQDFIKYANEDLISALLPVLDNFDHAYSSLPASLKNDEWVRGVGYVKDQLKAVLTNVGVEEVAAAGADFDPNFHEAVEAITAPGAGKKLKIAGVVRKGYKLKGKLIRPARVKVE